MDQNSSTTAEEKYREALRVLILQYLWKTNHPKNNAVVILSEPNFFERLVNVEWALKMLGANPSMKPRYPAQRRVWMRHARHPEERESPFQTDLTLWEGWVWKDEIPLLKVFKKVSYWHRDTPKYPDPVWEQDLEDAYETWMKMLK